MKHSLFLVAIFASLVAASPQDIPNFPFLSVDVQVEADFKPDYAIMNLSIFSKSKDTKSAFDTIETTTRSLFATLSAIEINRKDIIAHDISKMNSDRYSSGNESSKPREYELSRNILVRLNNIDKYPAVIDTLSKLPFVNIYSTSFRLLHDELIEDSLLIEASKKARSKADRLAQVMNCRIISVQGLSERPVGDVWSSFKMDPSERQLDGYMGPAKQSTFSPPNSISKSKVIYVLFKMQNIK